MRALRRSIAIATLLLSIPSTTTIARAQTAAINVNVNVNVPSVNVYASVPGANANANTNIPGVAVNANAPSANINLNVPSANVPSSSAPAAHTPASNAPGADAAPAAAAPVAATLPVTSVSPLDGLPGLMLLASTRQDPKLSERAVNYRLYRYSPSDGILEQLEVPGADQSLGSASGALTADGTEAVVNAGGQELFFLDLTGSTAPRAIGDKLAPLSFASQDAYFSVALSPDGSTALVSRPVPTGEEAISTSDDTVAPVGFIPPAGQPPAFSTDGQWLAFEYVEPGSGSAKSIFYAPADGSAPPVKVTPDDVYESAASWGPDANSIVYAALDGSWQVRLWDFVSGTEQTIAEAPDGYQISDVAVSPDGAWVGYSLWNPKTLERYVQVSNLNDPTEVVVVPQDASFADRILGWVAGPTTAASADNADVAGAAADGGFVVDDGAAVTQTYTVRPGDTLTGVASQVYGDADLWRTLFEANRDRLTNADEVQVGQELRVPPLTPSPSLAIR